VHSFFARPHQGKEGATVNKPLMSIAFALAVIQSTAAVAQVAPAIYTDPQQDQQQPAGMEVLQIPTGGVLINGLAYTAAGPGPHPTLILFHGLPGNEKNLDIAQALRRAGWNVVTLNYRGSWGSPGSFGFRNSLEDARAALAYVRDPKNASILRVDTSRIVIAGHSMGGWITALTAAADPRLAGAILISPANLTLFDGATREQVIGFMSGNMNALAGTTAEKMADELLQNSVEFDFSRGAQQLSRLPLLVLSSDDGFAPGSDRLIASIRTGGGSKVHGVHVNTDHSWSDRRVRLQDEILKWLQREVATSPAD
jgi:uncharacterized protein